MKNFLEQVLIKTTSSLIVTLITSLLSILVVIFLAIKDPLSQIIYSNVPKTILLLTPFILLILFIFSILYINHLRKKLKKNLFSAFGVYWDKNLIPYCPSCKTILSNYGFYSGGRKNYPGFICIKCDSVIRLSDVEKIFMSYEEAKEKLKNDNDFVKYQQ